MKRVLIIFLLWTPSLASSLKSSRLSSKDGEITGNTCGSISCGVKKEQSRNNTKLIEESQGKRKPKVSVLSSNTGRGRRASKGVQPPKTFLMTSSSTSSNSSRASCQQTACGSNADCLDEGTRGAICRCHSGYDGDPYSRCSISPCHHNPCGLNADCSSSGQTAICKCRAGYDGDPLSQCRKEMIKIQDTCSDCGINSQCSNGVCKCMSGYIGDPYSRCHMDPCSLDVGNPCGKNGECYSVHQGVSAACKCMSSFPFGNPYRQCWNDPCIPNPCGRNTECISSKKANAAACRCKEGHFGNPHTECLANPCEPSPCGSNFICLHNRKAARCMCPKDATGDPYVACSSKPRQPRANPCATGVCGKGAECTNVRGRPVCTCLPGRQGDPYKNCIREECSTNNDCGYKEACYNYQCIDPCTEPCGIGAECFVRKHTALCRCPEGTTGDAFIHCRKFTRAEICTPCGTNTDCRVTVGNQPKCTCKPTYFGNPLTSCHRQCESDSACSSSQKCDRETFQCVDLCQPETSWPCGDRAICSAQNHQEICSCPLDFLGDPYIRCYAECTEAGDCSIDEECIRLRCKKVCNSEACGTGAKCKGTGHQALCFCPFNFTGNPKVLCKEIIIKDPCVPNPCGQAAICKKKVLFGRESTSCSCPVGYFGDPDVKCIKGECAKDDDCPDDKACFPDHYCQSPCSPSRYPCGRGAECHPTNHHGAVCSCPAGNVGDPLLACRRQGG